MIHLSSSILILNEHKQKLYYFVLPKSNIDVLMVNAPELMVEEFDKWIVNGNEVDLYLDAVNSKYTFLDAKVNSCDYIRNRYGKLSRDLTIKFNTMMLGFRLR